MVSGLRIEGEDGGSQIISPSVHKTILEIKQIVEKHSDAEIYVALKENNMDPSDTVNKLLNQDPFHPVTRKKDKKKASTGLKVPASNEPRRPVEHLGQGVKVNTYMDRNPRRVVSNRKILPDAGVTRKFRVVRDNRNIQNAVSEIKPINDPVIPSVSDKSSEGPSNNQKPQVGHRLSQSEGPADLHSWRVKDASSSGKGFSENKQSFVSNSASSAQQSESNLHPVTSTNSSVSAVISSSSDPVHVPSLDSRSAANVGAIKRLGAVGVRRRTPDNSTKQSSTQSNNVPKSQSNLPESATPVISAGRAFSNHQYANRSHQLASHQKAPQLNKEWKPKSSQKLITNNPGVIGTPPKSLSSSVKASNDLVKETAQLQDKLSRANIHENQNVIIAENIRVSESDRGRLIFGTLGTNDEPSPIAGFQEVQGADESVEPLASLSPQESSTDETSAAKLVESIEQHVGSSGSVSPVSDATSEHQLAERRESVSPNDYSDVGLVRGNNTSYTPESHLHQDPSDLPSFSAYDPQTGYDIPYFRPAVDESLRGQVLQIPQEALSSHSANSLPASTIAMVQQAAVPQMYPQVHVSHFANLMPYRQIISPMFVPPMAMPGYSNNPPYSPHPPTGSSYLLMPGANPSPHLTANNLKYGVQQYKTIPSPSPAGGFSNFTSPTGYAINAPGVVGSGAGLDDSSRLKYKDGNLYVSNPQAETSEVWMNPRDLSGMQSPSYYNMAGQTPHAAAAYMPAHASFNAQSSHMQFPGLYHPPPQPANPHHMGPTLGGNVGVGLAAAAPGAQVGGYQQPQLGHINWTGNY